MDRFSGGFCEGPSHRDFSHYLELNFGRRFDFAASTGARDEGQAAQVMEQKFRESLVSNAVSLPIKPENFRFTLSGSLLQVQVSGVQVLSPEGQAELKVQITEAIQKVLGLSFSGSTSTKIEISLQ